MRDIRDDRDDGNNGSTGWVEDGGSRRLQEIEAEYGDNAYGDDDSWVQTVSDLGENAQRIDFSLGESSLRTLRRSVALSRVRISRGHHGCRRDGLAG